jgi:hypothetical protein
MAAIRWPPSAGRADSWSGRAIHSIGGSTLQQPEYGSGGWSERRAKDFAPGVRVGDEAG